MGVHCNSPFQFFLVDRLSPCGEEEEMEETFEELRKHLDVLWAGVNISEKR